MSEDASRTVGVRELSHRTSRVLGRVKAGETVTITDHGEAIAAIIPLNRPDSLRPAVGYVSSADPQWAAHAEDNLDGFGE